MTKNRVITALIFLGLKIKLLPAIVKIRKRERLQQIYGFQAHSSTKKPLRIVINLMRG